MNENVQKSLIMGASIMVTIGVISIGMMIFGQGSSLVKESSKNMIELTEELDSKRYVAYDNSVVNGAEVINAINSYTDDGISVKVYTLSNDEGKTYTSEYSNTNKSNADYINTNGMFESKLITNSNGVITTIEFKQI